LSLNDTGGDVIQDKDKNEFTHHIDHQDCNQSIKENLYLLKFRQNQESAKNAIHYLD